MNLFMKEIFANIRAHSHFSIIIKTLKEQIVNKIRLKFLRTILA